MKKAILKITRELLSDILDLKDGCQVTNARISPDFTGDIELLISGDGLPDEYLAAEGFQGRYVTDYETVRRHD